jgi:hypothetical protein
VGGTNERDHDHRPASQRAPAELLVGVVESGWCWASWWYRRSTPAVGKGLPMKYFVLLAGYGELPSWDALTAEEQEAQMAKLGAFDEACADRPGVEILSSEALGDGSVATTLRTRGSEMTITDGPFAEAAEQIGGYYLLDAPDLDTVIELCRILPAYDIDIRPVLDTP